jgi:hypothetical protein
VARRPRVDLEKLTAEIERAVAPGTAFPAIEPVAVDLGARRTYSFSRLSGHLHRDDPWPSGFDTEIPGSIDPLGLGTLVHAVLAEVDFEEPGAWQELVETYAERQLLGADSPESEEAGRLIAAFLESPRAAQLAAATHSLAEAEFLLAWPPAGKVALRNVLTGYIDRLYQDDSGGWHVVDFKTNHVTRANLARIAAGYEMQMLVYALAAEQSLGAAPQSLVLHFLRGGLEFTFEWNDASHQRAIELVGSAIARASDDAKDA